MVMCGNYNKRFLSEARANPGRLGWLFGPTHFMTPKPDIEFALDNDAYPDWTKGKTFNYPAWVGMLDKVRLSGIAPRWVAVPDVVTNRKATLESWKRFAPVARCYGWPMAFVVQDGMTERDIPQDAALVFVGGSTQWKWRSIPTWVKAFPRVHVGRCGTSREKLDRLEQMGVESCDGSGFFRDTAAGKNARNLFAWLARETHQPDLVNL